MRKKRWTRRALLGTATGALVGMAGCSSQYENAIDDEETIDVAPAKLLPQTAQLGSDWEANEPTGHADEADNVYTIPNDSDLGIHKFNVYVSVTIRRFPTTEKAKEHFSEDQRIANGALDTSSADYGDEGYHGDGADDTHLHFRENNLYVDLTEMEGSQNAKSHLKSVAEAIVKNLESETGEN